jgi:choline dehydrogenase-like flavoprotein
MDEFDYVIVGCGAAGSLLAARLSEDSGASVCVLEAGPKDRHPFIHIPAGFIKTLKDPASPGSSAPSRPATPAAGASRPSRGARWAAPPRSTA